MSHVVPETETPNEAQTAPEHVTDPHALPPHLVWLDTLKTRVAANMPPDLWVGIQDKILVPCVMGFMDQLSIYMELMDQAQPTIGEVKIITGQHVAHLMIELKDRGQPLRLRDATARYDIELGSSRPGDFVDTINKRRQAFTAHHLFSLMFPLLEKVAEQVTRYYDANVSATFHSRFIRFMEDAGSSWLVLDIDDRRPIITKDSPALYRI